MKSNLPEDWKEVKLNDIAILNKSNYKKGDNWTFVNYLDTGNITNGTIDEISCIDLSIDKLPSRARRKATKDDVIYSSVRPIQKHLGIIKSPMKNMLVSTGFIVITSDEKELNPSYLYFYLNQNSLTQHLQSIAEQRVSTYPALNVSDIQTLKIKLPTLSEQRVIADTLSALDDKIELNNKINENLEQQAQAIFKHWFIDFEFPDGNGNPYKSSGGEMVESELGMIPKEWEVKKIGDLCQIASSKRIFREEYSEVGIPFYRGKEIIEKSKGNLISTELFITVERYNEIKKKFSVPQEKDILLTSVGTLGVSYQVRKEEFYFKDGNLTWFKSFKGEELKNYIYLFLNSFIGKEELNKITIGSTQKALTITGLKNIPIVLSNSSILGKYDNVVSSILNTINNNDLQNQNLSQIRDALLPKLMSGEVRIPFK